MNEQPLPPQDQIPSASPSQPAATDFPHTPLQPRRLHAKRILWIILALASVFLVVIIVFFTVLTPLLMRGGSRQPTGINHLHFINTFRSASCPFSLGKGIVEGRDVRCGYVTVPENRQQVQGAKVRLAVAIFKSPTVQNDALPVIRLEGGPGYPSLDDWARYIDRSNLTSFVFNHDLIMFDQRGTGYSTPSLNCPEDLQLEYKTLDIHLSASATEQEELQARTTCYNRLRKAGVDLSAFNSLEDAADVHDIITALGYKQANIYGVSYGTRLAVTTMRLFPSVIHSVVLDSAYPPQRTRTAVPAAAQRAFNTLFEGCAINSLCNARYPHLDQIFYQLVTDLNANPVHFQTVDATSNKSYKAVIAGDDFVLLLFVALYVTPLIFGLPQMIYQVHAHNYTILSRLFGIVNFDPTFSDGMFFSDECSEDWAFVDQNAINASIEGITPQIRPAFKFFLQQESDTCKFWNVQPAPAIQKQAVVSSIPTLVLSDEYDPIMPPANGRLVAQTLKNSYYFVFPGLGHGAEYSSPCPDEIISQFDDNPTQKPSSTCISRMKEPNFT